MPAIHVPAKNPWHAQEQLGRAEEQLRLQAMQSRTHGILVTKIDAGHYVLALSERVPYGFTHQEHTSFRGH
ncbi:hypothetical protein LVY72_23210 [Arthrobacter sp. I2-34]|uniref:Uncharacterized protein n=1 Tax=Arthrobacter hankyongi TaxID=2904801 RepID=A0ABS9LEC8_9MICC|nr:hypothetical protein [Arthrobacter hankyongi]MCG2624802.1 hypothetical protein [Arthrobacter hankyongi]